jgi:hypothetical protein
VTRGRRQKATAPLERRSLAVSPPRNRSDRLPRYVGLRFNQPSAWAMKSVGLGIVANRLIGDDGARPEVGGCRRQWTNLWPHASLGSSAGPFIS